jgi:hypothetical protein
LIFVPMSGPQTHVTLRIALKHGASRGWIGTSPDSNRVAQSSNI